MQRVQTAKEMAKQITKCRGEIEDQRRGNGNYRAAEEGEEEESRRRRRTKGSRSPEEMEMVPEELEKHTILESLRGDGEEKRNCAEFDGEAEGNRP